MQSGHLCFRKGLLVVSEGNNVFQVIGQIGDDYEKAKKLANYWKPGNKENREKEKERAR